MERSKKELYTSLILIGFAAIILAGSLLALQDIKSRQAELTGRFITDNGCYGLYNAGRLNCISSNLGKQCINGCYLANTPAGQRCECLQE